jgi:hypothetical protein
MTLTSMQSCLGLFMILVVILLVNPGFYNNMYNNILGRLLIIILIIFFAMNNVTLGLLVALIIIIGTNMYFTEGLETIAQSINSVGDDTKKTKITSNIGTTTVTTRSSSATKSKDGKKSKDDTKYNGAKSKEGVDRLSLFDTIKSKPSDHTAVFKENFTSIDVFASNPSDLNTSLSKFMSNYSSA